MIVLYVGQLDGNCDENGINTNGQVNISHENTTMVVWIMMVFNNKIKKAYTVQAYI